MKKILILFLAFYTNLFFTQSATEVNHFFKEIKKSYVLENDSVKKHTSGSNAYLEEITKNFTGMSNSKVNVGNFPQNIPEFIIDSDTSGWSYLNTYTQFSVTKSENIVLINIDGVSQIDNVNNYSSYQFALGIFIDDQLKLVKKFQIDSAETKCNFKKFDFAGVLENLSLGNHVIKVYAYNLPKLSNNYTHITYGGAASNLCDNIDEGMARIHLNAQLAE
ncbi:hypothetical protein [Cloacibacterium sp. TD35]|uniref:hypothetical protein n=1 Tax=Cloacibacterium sp. TD35 TaxID=2976818 RepID=UPI00237DE85D|nr:hypothetical protein [Cloacibacterium sp. TD35]WDT67592.1 hypothetical protein N7277_09660 [Cloacibacterium sp. TD35]